MAALNRFISRLGEKGLPALLSFLDCYSRYHQIALKEQDQSKTSFITPFGAYCYRTMSFGLNNAGTTYQRAIQTCLGDQIGENIKAYVDDVVVKTKNPDTLIEDLKQTFENLKRWRWKLNPNKCVFGVIVESKQAPSKFEP